MAGKYKPLRVPIDLLHQRIYATSQRLEPFVPLVKETALAILDRRIDSNINRVISPGGFVASKDSLFARNPHLRRFFYMLNSVNEIVVCRNCGTKRTDLQGRSQCSGTCWQTLNATIQHFMGMESCMVCEKKITPANLLQFDKLPVCCDGCLVAWDMWTPPLFKDALAIVKRTQQRFKS